MDFKRPAYYLHQWIKAWNYHFASVRTIAEEVLRIKDLLVQKVDETLQAKEIIVVMRGGLVESVIDVPEGVILTVVDYDVEDLEPERLQVSPLDGEACTIEKYP